jgi:hypothetical protein
VSGASPPDIRNERIRLTATYLNTAAGSSLAIGVLTPVAAAFFYNAAPSGLRVAWIVIGIAFWSVTSLVLHFLARWILRGLR